MSRKVGEGAVHPDSFSGRTCTLLEKNPNPSQLNRLWWYVCYFLNYSRNGDRRGARSSMRCGTIHKSLQFFVR